MMAPGLMVWRPSSRSGLRIPVTWLLFGCNTEAGIECWSVRRVLNSAIKRTELAGIYVEVEIAAIDHVHQLFDEHEVVFAHGAPSESLLLHPETVAALSPEARDEIRLPFPEIGEGLVQPEVRFIPEGYRQTRLADRMARNGRKLPDGFEQSA